MSQRSLIEINHDYNPGRTDEELLAWAKRMRNYVRSGVWQDLPEGITLKWRRHHSDPCPFDEPTAFERRFPRSRDNLNLGEDPCHMQSKPNRAMASPK